MFYLFYDLENSPTTFNIIFQLISGELARRELFPDHEKTFVVFVPGKHDGFNAHNVHDVATKKWRFHNIVLPSLSLIPSIAGHVVLPDRASARPYLDAAGGCLFPLGYTLKNDADCAITDTHNLNHALGFRMPSLVAPQRAREFVARRLAAVCPNQDVAVLTIRQATYAAGRNPDSTMVSEVAKYLRGAGFFVILLPDYDVLFDVPDDFMPGCFIFREAVSDLLIRNALYEASTLNLGGGGHHVCTLFNENANYIHFHILVDGIGHSSEEELQRRGYTMNKDPNYYESNFGRYVWRMNSADDVIAVCEDFVDRRKTGAPLKSDHQFTSEDIFAAFTPRFGEATIAGLRQMFGGRKNGPVFINRETIGPTQRVNTLRTKFNAHVETLLATPS